MHIPDGLLTPSVLVGAYLIVIGYLTATWKRIKFQLSSQSIPKVALLAAFLFVAQMINIPVSGGTSGHLMGAAFLVLVSGPRVATMIMAVVLGVQTLIFQDGGLTAWGTNTFNMGIVAVWAAYAVLKLPGNSVKSSSRGLKGSVRIFLAAWISIVLASVFCGVELALSGLAPLQDIVYVMAVIHAGIGILEGLLTVLMFQVVYSQRPDLVYVQ